MKENFEKALKIVLEFEGGYVNDPDDPGGATNYGITQAVYDMYRFDGEPSSRDVKNINRDEVSDIYYRDYWIPSNCEKLPPGLDIFHFDTAVNCGVRTAGRLLQKAVNSSEIETIKVDGIIGPKTLYSIQKAQISRILLFYVSSRKYYYKTISETNKSLEKFYNGWMNRVDKLFRILEAK